MTLTMSGNAKDHDDEMGPSSEMSPTSSLSPTWRPPKSPLPPHRLAKIANALGVSTPVPVNNGPPGSHLIRSLSESSKSAELTGRSPTPSASPSSMGFSTYSPATSKFLLHVIPPLSLPHDSPGSGASKRLPVPNAPGYHRQFRRGTLVPVHATLHAQLGAIAREYALPSTTGIILYLINSSPQSPLVQEDSDEPGPRLSEEIWRHLWMRVLRVERQDEGLLSSRSPTPLTGNAPHQLGYNSVASPSFTQERSPSPLRPLMALASGQQPPLTHAPHPTYPLVATATSPSTPSTASDLRSNSKSAPPSSTSQSEPDTPDTSVEDSGLRVVSLDLPGLTSTSLIPILAKVEFDIDKRKAAWFEPWLRSRRVNHAKRKAGRKGQAVVDGDTSQEGSRSAPLTLLTVKKSQRRHKDPLGLSTEPGEDADGYARLSESPLSSSDEESQYDEDDDDFEDLTARVSPTAGGKDPLADLFGTDADVWADIRAEGSGRRRKQKNPNVVDLAITGGELSALLDVRDLTIGEDQESSSMKEADEVMQILQQMGGAMTSNGKRLPPALSVSKAQCANVDVGVQTPNSTDLAYMEPSREDDPDFSSQRDSDKRGGTVFDDLDLDLGLDPTEDFDLNDPLDHRRSQLMMRAQLDEIERTMAQLSPRMLNLDIPDQSDQSFSSPTLSPGSPSKLTLSPVVSPRSTSLDVMASPSSARLPRYADPPDSPPAQGASWPAVPFSALKGHTGQPEVRNGPPSPPRLAVNGITTSAPKSYAPTRAGSTGPTESEKRRKELEEENALYPPRGASRTSSSGVPDTPVIPLSPDPFGRFPSTESDGQQAAATQWAGDASGAQVQNRARSGTTTSRFSIDSAGDEPASAPQKSNRTTLMSVKSIRKLWRKSKDKVPSPSEISPIPSVPSSGRTSPMAPQRPERPSQEDLDLPDMPNITVPSPTNLGRLSPQLMPPSRTSLEQSGRRTPQEKAPPPRASMDQYGRPGSSQLGVPQPITTPHMRQSSNSSSNLDRLHFDQESPYPTRLSPSTPRQSPRPPSPPPLPAIPEKDQVQPPSPPEEKNIARKSILKWRNGSNNTNGTHKSTGSASENPARQSFERPNATNGNGKGRRPSVINFGSTRGSPSSQDIPKSPPIPAQYVAAAGIKSAAPASPTISSPSPRQTTLSTRSTSPPRSMASSRDSIGSRPSVDVSQFEFVSPKAGATLSYPYTAED